MSPATHARDRLGDFTAGPRILLVAAMAAVIGALAAGVAAGLVHLINGITALAYFHWLSATDLPPGLNRLGAWAVLVPVVSRDGSRRWLGTIDGSAVAVAWSELRDEGHVREARHLFAQLRLVRRKMRHVMRPVAFTGNGGMET